METQVAGDLGGGGGGGRGLVIISFPRGEPRKGLLPLVSLWFPLAMPKRVTSKEWYYERYLEVGRVLGTASFEK